MFPHIKPPKKPVYLDYAATTPVIEPVKKAMAPFWSDEFGNPSSLYKQGRVARQAVEEARASIANLIGAQAKEIIFTAGGTESVNAAILGTVKVDAKKHIITSVIEHHCVLRTCEFLQKSGADVTYVSVDSQGFIILDELKKAIKPETVLISVMYANNEIGTIQPIAQIGKLLKKINAERYTQGWPKILFHTDACQAAGFLDLHVDRLGVDLMSVNGSKIYGPKQVGFLYARSGVTVCPIMYGGGQEKNVRSGTENVPGVVGLARALALVYKDQPKENARLIKLRNYFWKELNKKKIHISLNGPALAPAVELQRLPNNIHCSFDGIEGETLLIYLDSYNIAVSTGSACATSQTDPSHVLLALGMSPAQASSSIRITLGKFTTKKDLEYVLKVLPGIIDELKPLQNGQAITQ